MKKQQDIEQSVYEALEAVESTNVQIKQKKVQQKDLQTNQINGWIKKRISSQKQVEEENQKLKKQLFAAEQKNQQYMKQLQQKNEHITYLSVKSLDFAKQHLESLKKIEAIETDTSSYYQDANRVQEESSAEKMKQKALKYKRKYESLKRQLVTLKTQLEYANRRGEEQEKNIRDLVKENFRLQKKK